MERKAREGRAKSAETLEANSDSARLNELYRFENEVYKLDSDSIRGLWILLKKEWVGEMMIPQG